MTFRESSQEKKNNIKLCLSKCESLGDMLEILSDNYELKKVKLGTITKTAYVTNLFNLLNTLNPEEKTK